MLPIGRTCWHYGRTCGIHCKCVSKFKHQPKLLGLSSFIPNLSLTRIWVRWAWWNLSWWHTLNPTLNHEVPLEYSGNTGRCMCPASSVNARSWPNIISTKIHFIPNWFKCIGFGIDTLAWLMAYKWAKQTNPWLLWTSHSYVWHSAHFIYY